MRGRADLTDQEKSQILLWREEKINFIEIRNRLKRSMPIIVNWLKKEYPELAKPNRKAKKELKETLTDRQKNKREQIGLVCSECGIYYNIPHGYPVLCKGCIEWREDNKKSIGNCKPAVNKNE